MSTITKTQHYKKQPLFKLLLSALVNPLSFLQLFWEGTTEMIQEIAEGLWGRFLSFFESTTRNPVIFSIGRVFFNVIASELITLGSILDMQRGVPIIYTNYIGYDELGHHRGPRTLSAYRVLKTIDRRIRRIISQKPDDYDLYILSDHGMTTSQPFESKFGYTLQEFVSAAVHEPQTHEQHTKKNQGGLYLATLWKIASIPLLPFKPIAWWFRVMHNRRTKNEALGEDWVEPALVRESSGLAHIYFTEHKRTLHRSEIIKKYPGIIQSLVEHPAVGVVVLRNGKKLDIHVRGTKLTDKNKRLLDNFGDADLLLQQIAELMKMKNCGDIVVFSDFDGRCAVSFANHYGLHSGMGGPQNEAFLIAKKESLPQAPLEHAMEVREYFSQYM